MSHWKRRIYIAVGALGVSIRPACAVAQAPADSVPLTANTEARARGDDLGTDWKHGRIVQIFVSGAGECLGFAPDPPSKVSAASLDAIDSLEVAVRRTRPQPNAAPRDTLGRSIQWAGIPRHRRQVLSSGCQRPRP